MNQKIACHLLVLLGLANSAYGDSSGIEEHRKKLCMRLTNPDRCEEPKQIFGAPPPNSVSETKTVKVCAKGACKVANSFPDPRTLPGDSYVETFQTLSIITKNGKRKTWSGKGSFPGGPDGFDGTGDEYRLEFDQHHSFFWVQESIGEGMGKDIWIAYESGKTYVFEDQPHLSPDGNFFFVIKNSEDGIKQQFVRIYSLKENEIIELANFNLATEKVQGEFFWTNSNEIVVISHILRNHTFQDVVTARIWKAERKWILSSEKDG